MFRELLDVLTYDCPFEESLIVYYLRSDLRVLDDIELGIPYHSGELASAEPVADDSIEFSFFGEDRWQLTATATPRWRVELPRLLWARPQGLCFRARDLGRQRYLRVRKVR